MICSTCDKPHPWPDGTTPIHEFNGIRPAQAEALPDVHPFDPVLRQALIDKGVLTVEELQAAASKIAIITNAVVPRDE